MAAVASLFAFSQSSTSFCRRVFAGLATLAGSSRCGNGGVLRTMDLARRLQKTVCMASCHCKITLVEQLMVGIFYGVPHQIYSKRSCEILQRVKMHSCRV